MIDQLISSLADQKLLILGFGREGQSTYHFLRKHLPEKHLFIADQRPDFWQIDDPNVTIISGPTYLEHLNQYDLIIKSPGISLAKIDLDTIRSKITSELELLLEFSTSTTIGITGTKGKSTTSSLIYQILQDQQIPSLLLGNIGTPVFEYLDSLTPDQILVLEMSSHQLEFMHRSPHIALLLNLYEEHLDHYLSFRHYAAAKCNIFEHQTEKDYFIYNYDDKTLREFISHPPAKAFPVSLSGANGSTVRLTDGEVYFDRQPIYSASAPRHLLGDYNLQNIMFALAVAKILQLDLTQASATIANFKTLHHRLEFVGEFNGVRYFDNSIGTIPMATISAIQTLRDVDTVIIGGMDRGLNYTEFANFLNQNPVRNVICMSATGRIIAPLLSAAKVQLVANLPEAVARARELTAPGKICLLSPAAASYGEFKNFEEKGDLFQQLVRSQSS